MIRILSAVKRMFCRDCSYIWDDYSGSGKCPICGSYFTEEA